MATTIWGLLKESLTSSKLIREAIADMIADHDNDPASHLGETGSLQSHKASEIIDHLAASVVSDKLQAWINGTFLGSFSRNDFHWTTIFESIDGYDNSDPDYVTVGYTGVRIQTSTALNNYQFLQREIYLNPVIDWSRPMKLSIGVQFVDTTHQNVWLGVGDCTASLPNPTIRHIGFKVIDGTIYGTVANGTTETTLNLGSVSAMAKTVFAFDFDGSVITFYIDGVNKGTISTNIPTGNSNADVVLSACIKVTLAGAYKTFFLSTWDYWIGILS
jgi:hypothetical protein